MSRLICASCPPPPRSHSQATRRAPAIVISGSLLLIALASGIASAALPANQTGGPALARSAPGTDCTPQATILVAPPWFGTGEVPRVLPSEEQDPTVSDALDEFSCLVSPLGVAPPAQRATCFTARSTLTAPAIALLLPPPRARAS